MLSAITTTAQHALVSLHVPAGVTPHGPDEGLRAALAEAGVHPLASHSWTEAPLHDVLAWAENNLIATTAGALIVLNNVRKRVQGSDHQKNQAAIQLMTGPSGHHDLHRLRAVGELLNSIPASQIKASFTAGTAAHFPAHYFLRGAELVVSGPAESRDRFLLDMMRAATGHDFDSVAAFNDAFQMDYALARGLVYRSLKSEWSLDSSQHKVVMLRGRDEVDAPGLMHGRPSTAVNPPGYFFTAGGFYCTVRPGKPRDGDAGALSIRLSMRYPATRDIEYKGPRPLMSGKGPMGLSAKHARIVVPLPPATHGAAAGGSPKAS